MGPGARALLCVAAIVGLALWLAKAQHDSREELRKLIRDGDNDLEDIRNGTYRPPVKVRAVR